MGREVMVLWISLRRDFNAEWKAKRGFLWESDKWGDETGWGVFLNVLTQSAVMGLRHRNYFVKFYGLRCEGGQTRWS